MLPVRCSAGASHETTGGMCSRRCAAARRTDAGSNTLCLSSSRFYRCLIRALRQSRRVVACSPVRRVLSGDAFTSRPQRIGEPTRFLVVHWLHVDLRFAMKYTLQSFSASTRRRSVGCTLADSTAGHTRFLSRAKRLVDFSGLRGPRFPRFVLRRPGRRLECFAATAQSFSMDQAPHPGL